MNNFIKLNREGDSDLIINMGLVTHIEVTPNMVKVHTSDYDKLELYGDDGKRFFEALKELPYRVKEV